MPVDSKGATLAIGDRVQLTRAALTWKIGEQGTIRSFDSGYGVEFDRPGEGHNLQGACPPGKGYWLTKESLIKVAPAISALDSSSDFIKHLEGSTNLVVLDGKVYTVNLSIKPDATSILSRVYQEAGAQVTAVRSEALSQITKVKAEFSTLLPMPKVNRQHIEKGLRVFYYTPSVLCYSVPMEFKPLYLSLRSTIDRELSSAHKTQLYRPIVHLGFLYELPSRAYMRTCTFLPDFKDFFYHYHGGDSNCIGTLSAPRLLSWDDVGVLFEFAKQYSKALEMINISSPLHSAPRDLPSIEDLSRSSTPYKTSASSFSVPKSPFTVNDLVVVSSGFSDSLTSRIGRVYHPRAFNTIVEFLFEIPTIHTLDSMSRVSIPNDKLSLAPPGSRRSRVMNGVPEPTPISTPDFGPVILDLRSCPRLFGGEPYRGLQSRPEDGALPAVDSLGRRVTVNSFVTYAPNLSMEHVTYTSNAYMIDSIFQVREISWDSVELCWKLYTTVKASSSSSHVGQSWQIRALDTVLTTFDPSNPPDYPAPDSYRDQESVYSAPIDDDDDDDEEDNDD